MQPRVNLLITFDSISLARARAKRREGRRERNEGGREKRNGEGKGRGKKGEARRVNGSGKNEGEKATASETLMRRAVACGCARIHSRAPTTASTSSQTRVVDPRQVVQVRVRSGPSSFQTFGRPICDAKINARANVSAITALSDSHSSDRPTKSSTRRGNNLRRAGVASDRLFLCALASCASRRVFINCLGTSWNNRDYLGLARK